MKTSIAGIAAAVITSVVCVIVMTRFFDVELSTASAVLVTGIVVLSCAGISSRRSTGNTVIVNIISSLLITVLLAFLFSRFLSL